MNWKTWIPLMLAVVLGLIAAKAGRELLVRAQRAGVSDIRFTKVVISRGELETGHTLCADDLLLCDAPTASVPGGAFSNPADLTGRVLIQPLTQRQPVLENALAPQGACTAVQAMVPKGLRAITMQIDEASGMAGLLTPGCRVDVVSAIQDEKLSQVVARTIVEDVGILAVGQRLAAPTKKEGEEPARNKTVTLLVSPHDAEAIELASAAGRMPRLVLRGVRDSQHVATTGITAAELLGGQRKTPERPAIAATPAPQPQVAQAAPAKAPSRYVEIIRNGLITRVEMPGSIDSSTAVAGQNAELGPAIPGQSP